MLRLILVLIVAYLFYLIHRNIKNHNRSWSIIITTIILFFLGMGIGGNATEVNANHHTVSEVQTIKKKYINEKKKTPKLKHANLKFDEKEKTAKSEKNKILSDYNKQKIMFKQEAEQKHQEKEQLKKEKKAKADQEKQQREQQLAEQQRQYVEKQQTAEIQKQQTEQQRQQIQSQTPTGQPKYSNNQQGQMVWIAPNSGKKYHYDQNCRGLRRANGNITQITEQQAKDQGYTLCGFEGG